MKSDEAAETQDSWGKHEVYGEFCLQNVKIRARLSDLGVEGGIMLKYMLEK
jgi:hypothetical protein